jgi:hypothetical protein
MVLGIGGLSASQSAGFTAAKGFVKGLGMRTKDSAKKPKGFSKTKPKK